MTNVAAVGICTDGKFLILLLVNYDKVAQVSESRFRVLL